MLGRASSPSVRPGIFQAWVFRLETMLSRQQAGWPTQWTGLPDRTAPTPSGTAPQGRRAQRHREHHAATITSTNPRSRARNVPLYMLTVSVESCPR